MAKRINEKKRIKKCDTCNKEFRCKNREEIKNKRFCSRKCSSAWLGKILSKARKGKGNPMYGKTGWNKGMKMSKEHCKKLSEAHKGQIPWTKGKKRPPFSKEWKEKISNSLRGRKITWTDKLKGPKTEEHKRNISLANMGEKNHSWRGGVYEDQTKSPRYKRWRDKIVKRDNYECQECSSKEKLEVHHKKPKKYYPDLMYNDKNAVTLCNTCHKKIHYNK